MAELPLPPQPDPGPPFRIELVFRPGARDARGESVVTRAGRDLGIHLQGVETRDVYLLDGAFTGPEVEQIARAFEDPVVQQAWVGAAPALGFDWALQVGFKPGVTDNVGRTAKVAVVDLLGRPLEEEAAVYTATLYLLRGRLEREQVERLAADLLANPLIHRIGIRSFEEWSTRPPSVEVPRAQGSGEVVIQRFDLEVGEDQLLELSRESLWALNREELRAIRDHFRERGEDPARRAAGLDARPTDVEMETLAQTWSEHCKHKIFHSRITCEEGPDSERREIDSLFKTYIKGATATVAAQVDWLLSVFKDNAGVVRFTESTDLVYKVETHNSPSALDPYGGAITGIVGVNRDPFGTGRGAELMINVWGYCFASPFYKGEVPEGLMHPRRIRDGVHQGVIDGGNQSGIPYGRGWELFDERYLGKPLVYCGTVGLMPATVAGGEPAHVKVVAPGHIIVMVGGRIGADGIHGATFSSQELTAESPSQAVQIGDPITQKKMTDFLLEARDLGLYTSITDNGAGGLSSSVGEMATATGGAELDLALAPLKYPGLQPWEILLSEAQERMTVAVPPDRLPAFLDLAGHREVEATPLGRFTDSGWFCVRYGEQTVALLDLEFLHEGWPRYQLTARWDPPPIRPLVGTSASPAEALRGLLASDNLCSKEPKGRQYDHEVQARTVVKPFTGICSDVPADATVFLVDYDRPEGVVLAEGVNPWYSDIDTRAMALAVTDEAVRRLVAAGARPGTIAALDNFCWPDPVLSPATPDGPYKLAQLVRACEGLYEACVAYGVPLISGKDSMKNDSTRGGVKISIPPTLLVSALGRIDDVGTARTPEPKAAGDEIWLLGETRPELGASEFARWIQRSAPGPQDGAVGGRLPAVDPTGLARRYERLHRAIAAGLVESVKTPTLGGLGVALAWMAFGAGLGLAVNLDQVPVDEPCDLWELLFAESAGRFLLTVRPGGGSALEEALASEPLARLGTVTAEPRLRLDGEGRTVLDEDIHDLKAAWQAPMADL
jgi:phosphoribosylformylglycinamidine synthase II